MSNRLAIADGLFEIPDAGLLLHFVWAETQLSFTASIQ